jgi:hypothetical protein
VPDHGLDRHEIDAGGGEQGTASVPKIVEAQAS